jgi:N-acyl-L-homoserine lactone synthetase
MSSYGEYAFYDAGHGMRREQAVRLHHARYEEVGFFAPDENDPYEPTSTYFVAESLESNQIVGVTRLIFEKMEELPTMKFFTIYDIERAKLQVLDKRRYAEISAFTKMPQHDVALGLIRAVLQYSTQFGLTHWICCLDERVYNYMHRMFKFPFKVIGVPQVYLGSKTIPCSLNLAECLATLQMHRPALHEYLTLYSESKKEVVQ